MYRKTRLAGQVESQSLAYLASSRNTKEMSCGRDVFGLLASKVAFKRLQKVDCFSSHPVRRSNRLIIWHKDSQKIVWPTVAGGFAVQLLVVVVQLDQHGLHFTYC